MKNITSLRDWIIENAVATKAKKIEPKVAKELNNSAGKVIATLVLELKYAQFLAATPKGKRIDFLESIRK